jgi:organic radical activating enzyme
MEQLTDFDQTKDFYCSQKFWWLSVDLEKLKTMSCCAATPAKINFDHINRHPGDLFNSPEMITERQQMLLNQPVSSCASTCWIPESKLQVSRRLSMKSHLPTHTATSTSPEVLHIIVGSDCNMTCVYCCKYYSSAWARDIANHGAYSIATTDDKYILNDTDRVLMKLSQKDIKNNRFNDSLLDEIAQLVKSSNLKEIIVTGGEPFLYLGLEELASKLSRHGIPIKIYSGLGVNTERFQKEIAKISKYTEIELMISVESTGKLYELLRNGNTWDRFEKNIEILKEQGIRYSFYSTVTNLALLGIDDFIKYAGDVKILWSPCTDPDFFAVNILDSRTKSMLIDRIDSYPLKLQEIINTVSNTFVPDQKSNLDTYLKEFTQRRNIDLGTLPQHFVEWLEQQ